MEHEAVFGAESVWASSPHHRWHCGAANGQEFCYSDVISHWDWLVNCDMNGILKLAKFLTTDQPFLHSYMKRKPKLFVRTPNSYTFGFFLIWSLSLLFTTPPNGRTITSFITLLHCALQPCLSTLTLCKIFKKNFIFDRCKMCSHIHFYCWKLNSFCLFHRFLKIIKP